MKGICVVCGRKFTQRYPAQVVCDSCLESYKKRRAEDLIRQYTDYAGKRVVKGGRFRARTTCIVCGKRLHGRHVTACPQHGELWRLIRSGLKQQIREEARKNQIQADEKKYEQTKEKHDKLEQAIKEAAKRGISYGVFMATKGVM